MEKILIIITSQIVSYKYIILSYTIRHNLQKLPSSARVLCQKQEVIDIVHEQLYT